MVKFLEGYHTDGLLHKQTHPTLDLTIWNYSPKVQYERLWDEITLQCRGLVTNSKGEIVARPFKKFFNYEEHKPEDLPNESFEVYEKMDGSLGILFYYEYELSDERRYNIWFNNNYETGMERFFDPNNLPDYDNSYYEPTPKTKGEWIIATRGSFTSPQAIKGKELLEKYNFERLHTGYTYLFEIIYKENRIVCDYDYDDLVLLGMINTKTGDEINIHNDDEDVRFKNMISNIGFRVVMLYKTWGEGYDLLKEEISNDREGYVIRFKNGFRMKIKGEEYKRLHRILTNISNRDIWEYLKDNKPFDELLEKVPDEFNQWVKETVRDLRYACFQLRERAGKLHDGFRYGKYGDRDPEPSKKEFAEFVMKQQKVLHAIMFAMWNGNNEKVDDIIWKIVKPEYSKPFKKDEN
jgi:RNA ligase